MYVFPKKKVTYLGDQVCDQVWKFVFSRQCVKAGRIGDPTGGNVEPCPKHRAVIQSDCEFLADICNADIQKTTLSFSTKTYSVPNELL